MSSPAAVPTIGNTSTSSTPCITSHAPTPTAVATINSVFPTPTAVAAYSIVDPVSTTTAAMYSTMAPVQITSSSCTLSASALPTITPAATYDAPAYTGPVADQLVAPVSSSDYVPSIDPILSSSSRSTFALVSFILAFSLL